MFRTFLLFCWSMFPATTALGQGTINFTTRIPGVVDVKFVDCETAKPVSGPGWTAQLYGEPAGLHPNLN